MGTGLEDLTTLKLAEKISDGIWESVMTWDGFARDVVGQQLARAADSIGANITESFGRYRYGEKLQFLYYARGSLFETKYWLNRARQRSLMSEQAVETFVKAVSDLGRQLNAFARSLRRQSNVDRPDKNSLREAAALYEVDHLASDDSELISDREFAWLSSLDP